MAQPAAQLPNQSMRFIMDAMTNNWVEVTPQPRQAVISVLEDYITPRCKVLDIKPDWLLNDVNDTDMLLTSDTEWMVQDITGDPNRYPPKTLIVDTYAKDATIKSLRFMLDGGVLGLVVADNQVTGICSYVGVADARVEDLEVKHSYFTTFLHVFNDTTVVLLRRDGTYDIIQNGKIVNSIASHAGASIVPVRSAVSDTLVHHHFGHFSRVFIEDDLSVTSASYSPPTSVHDYDGSYVGFTVDRGIYAYQLTDTTKPQLVYIRDDNTVIPLANKLSDVKTMFIEENNSLYVQTGDKVLVFEH